MKNTYHLLAFVLLLCIGVQSKSQSVPEVEGAVIIEWAQIERQEDSLCFSMRILVKADAINNRQDWSIIPELEGIDSEKQLFPFILINGRQKERHFNRKEHFENEWLKEHSPTYHIYIPHHSDTIIEYSESIVYQDWMSQSSLTIHQVLGSSREKRQLFTSMNLASFSEPIVVCEEKTEPVVEKPVPVQPEKHVIQGSSYIKYRVNSSVIHPDYMDNRVELEKIDESLQPILKNENGRLIGIYLTGYSSPEGSLLLNEELARKRSHALKDYLTLKYHIAQDSIWIDSAGENWDGLRELIQDSDLPDKQKILSIIDSPQSEQNKKNHLRSYPVWNTLLKEYFPLLRKVDYKIIYESMQINTE